MALLKHGCKSVMKLTAKGLSLEPEDIGPPRVAVRDLSKRIYHYSRHRSLAPLSVQWGSVDLA